MKPYGFKKKNVGRCDCYRCVGETKKTKTRTRRKAREEIQKEIENNPKSPITRRCNDCGFLFDCNRYGNCCPTCDSWDTK